MKKIIFLITLFIGVFCSAALAQPNQVTLVTYYPAPFGMYQEMRVMGKLGVGTTAPDVPLYGSSIIEVKGRISQIGLGQSTFLGYRAGYNDKGAVGNMNNLNVGVGYNALVANIDGRFNTAVGFQALSSSVHANQNTAVGINSLKTLTSGINNTAIGLSALRNSISGSQNTAVGAQAMGVGAASGDYNTGVGFGVLGVNASSGDYNTGVGSGALGNSTTGKHNTAVGAQSMSMSTNIGDDNSVLGYQALWYNVTGVNNTAVGSGTLSNTSLGTGNNNVAIGYQAGNNLASGSYNIMIGSGANAPSATSSNTLSIGNHIYATGLGTLIPNPNVGLGTAAPDTALTFGTMYGKKINLYKGLSVGLAFNGGSSEEFAFHLGNTNRHFSFYGGDNQASEVMRINGTGRVGIGVTPTVKLDVNGSVKVGMDNPSSLCDAAHPGTLGTIQAMNVVPPGGIHLVACVNYNGGTPQWRMLDN